MLDSEVLLYILSLLLIWQFVGYTSLMAAFAVISEEKPKDYSFIPYISIIVPTYNEERVIINRINNLLELNYPKDRYEIIVVDSGSSDLTARIVKDFINTSAINNLMLIIEDQRRGKASAINLGKKFANHDIILITDANSKFDANVLKEIGPHFKDQRVGAVGGRFIVLDPTNSITSSAQFYWDLEYIMRKGESILDSSCCFHGEINAWRRNLVDADIRMLTEDLDMAVHIRKSGYKVIYEPNAIVYEPSPSSLNEQIIQRKRTSIGTIQVMFKYWKYFLFPRDLYSFMIFPSHKGLPMISPFLIIGLLLSYISNLNINVVARHITVSVLLFVLLFILLIYLFKLTIRGKTISNEVSELNWLKIVKIGNYVLLNEYLILLAWKDFLQGRYSILWTKVDSTRN